MVNTLSEREKTMFKGLGLSLALIVVGMLGVPVIIGMAI